MLHVESDRLLDDFEVRDALRTRLSDAVDAAREEINPPAPPARADWDAEERVMAQAAECFVAALSKDDPMLAYVLRYWVENEGGSARARLAFKQWRGNAA